MPNLTLNATEAPDLFEVTASLGPSATATQSYSFVIRDMLFDTLTKRTPYFANYTARKTPMRQVQANLLPFLGVYIIDETMTPDGDANAGMVRFSHALRIGFSVIIANNDDVAAEKTLDAAYWAIMNRFWTDEYLMNLGDTYNPTDGSQNPDNVRIESIIRGIRKHKFGNANQTNETPVAELQYDITAFYRTMWWPDITDTLNEIDISTGVKIGDTQAQMNARHQLVGKYQFTAATKSKPNLFPMRRRK
jgi:hypothetical protein